MKISLLLTVLCISTNAYCQYFKGAPEKISELKSTTLRVILYDNAENYNEAIREIVAEKWPYGKYEFVQYDDAEKKYEGATLSLSAQRRGTSSATFWVPVFQFFFSNDLYSFYQLQNPGPYRGASTDTIARFVNKYSAEHIDLLFTLVVNNLKMIEQGTAGKESKLDYSPKSIKEYYNSDPGFAVRLKSGTIYIPKNEIGRYKPMGSKTDDEMLQPGATGKYYKGKHEVVKEAELAEVITEKSKGTYLLLTSIEGSIIVYYLVDLEKQQLVHYEFTRCGYGDVTCWKNMLEDLTKLLGI